MEPWGISELQTATTQADFEHLNQIIEQVREQHADLADILAGLAFQFDYESLALVIRVLTESVSETNS